MKKEPIYNKLIETGRNLVKEKGAEFLTARKLSEASGCSIGAIYNQFFNMDNFILVQNIITLDELNSLLSGIRRDKNAFKNLNNYLDAFVDYVLANKNLWFLLYNFHLSAHKELPGFYLKKLASVNRSWAKDFAMAFPHLSVKEKRLSSQVMWLSLFSLSSLLTTKSLDGFGRINRRTVGKLLLNTYLAGIRSLKKKG